MISMKDNEINWINLEKILFGSIIKLKVAAIKLIIAKINGITKYIPDKL